MGIAPLTRHRSTFSASSEDLARPQVEGVVTGRKLEIRYIILPSLAEG